MPKVKPERRKSAFRRQVNESFCDPNGNFSVGKFLSIWAQIAVFAHMNTSWDKLIDKPESLAIVLAILVTPDILKKLMVMKYGDGK